MKLFRIFCTLLVLLLSLVVFAFVPLSQASAASGRVTQGDPAPLLWIRPGLVSACRADHRKATSLTILTYGASRALAPVTPFYLS